MTQRRTIVATRDLTKVYGTTVIPAPNPGLHRSFSRNYRDGFDLTSRAVGVLETMGFVALLEATDAALDTADVAAGHWLAIGSGYNSISYSGDVAAVRAAMSAAEAVAKSRERFVDSIIIPAPHAATAAVCGAAQ